MIEGELQFFMFLCIMKLLKGCFRNISVGHQLVLLVLMMGLFSSLSLVMGSFLQADYFSISDTPLWVLLFRQSSDSIAFFILPILVFLYLRGIPVGNWLLGAQKNDFIAFFLIALMMIVSIPIVQALAMMNASIPFPESWQVAMDIEDEINMALNRLFESDVLHIKLWLFVVIAIIAPLGEEFLFRGVLMRWLNSMRWPAIWSIVFSGFIFSALHLQILGFIPRFLLGLLLGYLFYRSGALIYSVWAHFVYNGVSYLLQVSEPAYGQSESFSKAIGGEDVFVLLACCLLLFFSIFFFYKRLQKKEILPLT